MDRGNDCWCIERGVRITRTHKRTAAQPHARSPRTSTDSLLLPRLAIACAVAATRAFPPHHPLIPVDYQLTGQPVLIGGTMGQSLRAARWAAAGACRD